MILRRITQHVREQNWTAIGIDFLIVVVGVFVGIQLGNWNAARAERAEEQDLLRGLRAEFTEVMAGLDVQVAKHRRIERAVATILEGLAEAERSGASFGSVADTALAWALVPTTTQFSQGVLNGMLTTGRLGLIRERELRTALSEWAGVLADVTEDEIASRDIVMHQLEPSLWRQTDVRPFRRYALLTGELSLSEATTTSDVPVDAELIGVLATRRFWLQHLIREFEEPQAEAQRILGLIDRALE